MRTVTFEFSDTGKAAGFSERVRATYPEWRVRDQHRCVDVTVPSDAAAGDRDVIVMAAALFGATDEQWEAPAVTVDEPLYILKIGVGFAGDVLQDTEVSLVTAREFIEANGVQGQLAVSALTEPGSVTHGGGGASPRWRLERTAYVGRKVTP